MGDIVNLRLQRKRKLRAEKEQLASENRVRFGRTRAQREADRLSEARESAKLDAHRRSSSDNEEQ
ncbi:DUF4169 family protein [Chelativorans sp. J32]|uniref:DUF4169 family protein n=1 Tax=Chelativorans sp. J32 TaxID=935840 RepID=UPI000488D391|nr:DUF4169 family protein [Chelativorans sp. J32]